MLKKQTKTTLFAVNKQTYIFVSVSIPAKSIVGYKKLKNGPIFKAVTKCTITVARIGEASERRGGAHMDFSERIDTILNSVEPNC